MSRIAKKPIAIPAGVVAEVKGHTVKITGPKGTLEKTFVPEIEIRLDAAAKQIVVHNLRPDVRQAKAMHGTVRALIQNMIGRGGLRKELSKERDLLAECFRKRKRS